MLDLKPFRSQVKGKHYVDREFENVAVQGKETVDIDILITSRDGHRKNQAIQNNEQTSRENKEMEQVEPVQMNIYQNNAYREN